MTKKMILQDFLSANHNHNTCVDEAIAAAEKICSERNERFTVLRKKVLELVWASHRPVKAYDLLQQLADVHERPAPPTVYRALDFLQGLGLVHKIQSLNAYLGCSAPQRAHQGQFLICENCGKVAELDDTTLSKRIDLNAKKIGFKVNNETVEIVGLCKSCS